MVTPEDMVEPLVRLLSVDAGSPDPDAVFAEVGDEIHRWPPHVRAQVAECCEQVAWFCRDGMGRT